MPKRPHAAPDVAPRLLLVDRDQTGARAAGIRMRQSLSVSPQIECVGGGRAALERLRTWPADIVMMDLASLADLAEETDEAVGRLARAAEGALLIALSDGASVSAAVAAMRAGAHDLLSKPIDAAGLGQRIGELARRHGKARAAAIAPEPAAAGGGFAGFIGNSSQMQVIYEQIERIAPSAAPVFITGESGTGKGLCASALHGRSPRADQPFISVNCAAMPRELVESELFGVMKGAYTGATEDRRGAIERAHGGTLFLDEVGDLHPGLQARLLRFLQSGTVSRIGGGPVCKVDVRLICATNRNPMQLIAGRSFREDLFYRLHVLPIHLPPLRQRPEDILVLARHFLARHAGEEHKQFSGFSPEAALAMTGRDWPGNVRQLQNLTRRLAVLFDGGEISAAMVATADIESRTLCREMPAGMVPARTVLPMWQQEQRIIEEAIASFSGNIALAAAALELSPSTIYRKRQAWAEGQRKGAA